MEIQQLRVILALSEAGTMGRAAETLRVTQPAVSFALTALERELGYQIFYRSRRGLALTPRGEALLPEVREFLRIEERIRRGERGVRDDEGAIRIAGRQGFMQYVFPQLLDTLRRLLPKVRVEVALSGDQEEVIEQLRSGQADIAFAASPKIKSIKAEIFFEDPVWLAVSKNHILAKKRTLSPKEIAQLTLVLPSKGDRLRIHIDRYLRTLPSRPEVLLETNDYTLMRNLISETGCASFIYGHMLLSKESKKEFFPLPIRDLKLRRDLTVLTRAERTLPHVERVKNVMVLEAKRRLS